MELLKTILKCYRRTGEKNMSLREFYPKDNMTSKMIEVKEDTSNHPKCKKVINTMQKFGWYLNGDSEYTYEKDYDIIKSYVSDVKLYFRRSESLVSKTEKLEKECFSFMAGDYLVWLDSEKMKEYDTSNEKSKKELDKLAQDKSIAYQSLKKIEKYKLKIKLLVLLLIPSLLTIIIPFLGFYWIKFLIKKIKELSFIIKQEPEIRKKIDDIKEQIGRINGAASKKMEADLMSKVKRLAAIYNTSITYDDFVNYVRFFRSEYYNY